MDLGMRIALSAGAAIVVLILVAGVYWFVLRERGADLEADDAIEEDTDGRDESADRPRKKHRKPKKSAATYEERLRQRKAEREEQKQEREREIGSLVENVNAGIARGHDKSKRKQQARAMAVKWWQNASMVTILSRGEPCAKCSTLLPKGQGYRCRNLGPFTVSASGLVCDKCFMAGDYPPWDETLARVIECLDSRNAMLIEEVLPLSLNCPQCQASFTVKDGWEVVALNCPKCRHCVHRCSW